MKSTSSTTTDGPLPHRRRKKTFALSSRVLSVATAASTTATTSLAGNKHARSSSRHRHESSVTVAAAKTAAVAAAPLQTLHHNNNRILDSHPKQGSSLYHSMEQPLSHSMEKGEVESPPGSLSFNDDDCTAATTSTTTTMEAGHTEKQRLRLPINDSLVEEPTTEDDATTGASFHQRKRQKRQRQRNQQGNDHSNDKKENTSENGDSSYWQCQSCTLQNKARKRRCELCGERRAVSTTTTMSTTSSAASDTVAATMSTDMETHETGAAAAALAATLGNDDDGRHSSGPTVERTLEPLGSNTTTTAGTTMDKTNVGAAAPAEGQQNENEAVAAAASSPTASSWSLLCHPTSEAVEKAPTLATAAAPPAEVPPPPPPPAATENAMPSSRRARDAAAPSSPSLVPHKSPTMALCNGDETRTRDDVGICSSSTNTVMTRNDDGSTFATSPHDDNPLLPRSRQKGGSRITSTDHDVKNAATAMLNVALGMPVPPPPHANTIGQTRSNTERVETTKTHSTLEVAVAAAAAASTHNGNEITHAVAAAADMSFPSSSSTTHGTVVLHQWLLQQNSILQRQHETLQQLQQQTQELMNQTSSIATWLVQVDQQQQQPRPQQPQPTGTTNPTGLPLPSPLRALLPAQTAGGDAPAAAAVATTTTTTAAAVAAAAPSTIPPPMHAPAGPWVPPTRSDSGDNDGPDHNEARSHKHSRPVLLVATAPTANPAQLDLLTTTTPTKKHKTTTKQTTPSSSRTATTAASSSTDASPSLSSPDDSTSDSPKSLDNDNCNAKTIATPAADAATAATPLSGQTMRPAGSGLGNRTGDWNEAPSSPLTSERNHIAMQHHDLGDDPTNHARNNHSSRSSRQGLSPPKPPARDGQVDATSMEQAETSDAADAEQAHNQDHDNNKSVQRAFPYETRANGYSDPVSPPSPAGSTQTLEPDASPIRKHNARLFLEAERRVLQPSTKGASMKAATNQDDPNTGVLNTSTMLSQKASKPLAATRNVKRATTTLTGGGWTSNTSSRQFLRQLDQAKNAAMDNSAKAPTSEWLTTRRPPRPVAPSTTRPAAAATTADDRLWSGNQDGEPNYAYQEVVRCKRDRQNLPCHDCPQCRRFNEVLRNTGHYNEDDFAGNRNSTNPFGRHRARHARAETPVDFWELDFIDERDAALAAAAAAAQAEAAARANDTEPYE